MNKKAGTCFGLIAIVLLCAFVGWRGEAAYRASHSFEKFSYTMKDKYIKQAFEISEELELLSDIVEQVTEPVASPKLNIDLEKADFFVTSSRGGEYFLGYPDKETFLRDFGFEGKEPFYQYVEETSGELQMELYYDEGTAKGCGIRYFPEEGWEARGFVFNSSVKPLYRKDDYLLRGNSQEAIYSKLTYYGFDPSQDSDIDNFEEKTEYTDNGRIKHYTATATGWFTNSEDETEPGTVVEMDFVYREDGSLQRKDYFHNPIYEATTFQSLHSFYDKEERLVYEDGYITHGSLDHYYIYDGEEKEPSYYLEIDHNLGWLCATMFSCHDITGDEDGKCYGKIGPDLSNNSYVQAVREVDKDRKYSSDSVSHTYEMDYDGDGRREAFVIIGEYRDGLSGEPTEDLIDGSAWFVDSENNVMYLDTATFRVYQEYLWQDGKVYLFLHHSVGLPWETDIFTVEENGACKIFEGRSAFLSDNGQVIQVQDTYDSTYEYKISHENDELEGFWYGHTWKRYTFMFEHGKWNEIPAREVSRKQVDEIAQLPSEFDESQYDGVQYILRENGELDINVAKENEKFDIIDFSYFIYQLNDYMEWELMDEDSGIYLIQLEGESHWDYLSKIEKGETKLQQRKRDVILYQEVLEEFERLWNTDYEKESVASEEAKYAGEYFINAWCRGEKENKQLCYSLQDLSGDGVCELLIGIKYSSAYNEEMEVLQNIFTCQDGKISNIFRDENQGSQFWGLCEGNVIEVSRAVYGYGDYWYYALRPSHGEADLIDTVGYDFISREKGEEMYLYYDSMKNEISEEEFEEVLSKYPNIEISWKELKGFIK
ncbi:MAG: hypothetical protein HDR24_00640 [Lachnospiraceae bacterium]|nr:hypothetical protein [Lachnospiraceae bacterium]